MRIPRDLIPEITPLHILPANNSVLSETRRSDSENPETIIEDKDARSKGESRDCRAESHNRAGGQVNFIDAGEKLTFQAVLGASVQSEVKDQGKEQVMAAATASNSQVTIAELDPEESSPGLDPAR
ncbi:hypothetical protein A1Q1_05941 [Trichosporon asahii var. asahii CBS 2479]|uniref:Uncharacterized protein n=1 Tax=Trichosporon asahii var. asahii (strain ATCC 90039 / CBS 2479 / JCM 2466 / KCTC 7840 / NBRC 103889/ NCYC 2677 / UAMH 7654) TaxID=1186058 RepID=J6EMR8_TRIAS|nr:hypothetical protein A1Q1_05941 [Trichosporon asahii var. asahii CBS 2479]EJT45604.1 hypothetical protein A1Q1_05941 [Trichosporon asahii var. asahii CBS 2479]